jgi:hypothetical protein
MELARAAELIRRGPGIMAILPPDAEVEQLLDRARPLAAGDPAAEGRILTAEAFASDERDPGTRELAERGLELAIFAGDRIGESAALDMLTTIHTVHGEPAEAMACAVRRTELLAQVPMTADSALEFFDAFQMASACAVTAGDLRAAYRLGEGLCDLPFYREEDHLATSRLIVVGLLSGAWDEAVELSELFLRGWERAGRPIASNLSSAPYAAATVHGLRGNDVLRQHWIDVYATLSTPERPVRVPSYARLQAVAGTIQFREFFDALVLLHRGEADEAVTLLDEAPEELVNHFNGTWRPWYSSVWAEAAVLADRPDAAERVARARVTAYGNPVAEAVVRRAAGLVAGTANGRDDIVAAAAALRSLGAKYQWARTLVMLDGADRERGEQELAALGATPMAWPR